MNTGIGLFSLSILISTHLSVRVRSLLSNGEETCPHRRRCMYYVTGHGYGHAARSVVIIKALQEAGYEVEVVSTVSTDFFQQSIPGIVVHSRRLDSGAHQADALNVDAMQSLLIYKQTIHDNHDAFLNFETEFLKNARVDVVISDATPIACSAGKQSGAKVIILSNFCWDFIYSEMLQSIDSFVAEEYFPMIEQVSSDYSHADAIILHPGYNEPIGSYRRFVAPLISRLARCSRTEMRATLGISSDQNVLLLGFGGHSTSWKLEDSFLPQGWVCLVLSAQQNDMPSDRFIALNSTIYAPDYVAVSDVWIGKLGFGSVSEALAHGVPLIYIPRSSWPEERYLEEYILTKKAGIPMSENLFFNGDWESFLKAGIERKAMLTAVDTRDSPDRIVRMISDVIEH